MRLCVLLNTQPQARIFNKWFVEVDPTVAISFRSYINRFKWFVPKTLISTQILVFLNIIETFKDGQIGIKNEIPKRIVVNNTIMRSVRLPSSFIIRCLWILCDFPLLYFVACCVAFRISIKGVVVSSYNIHIMFSCMYRWRMY